MMMSGIRKGYMKSLEGRERKRSTLSPGVLLSRVLIRADDRKDSNYIQAGSGPFHAVARGNTRLKPLPIMISSIRRINLGLRK